MAEGTAAASPLAELIERNLEEIARRFVESARDAGASQALPPEDIIDSLREFLRDLAAKVRAECETGQEDLRRAAIAAEHAAQRFAIGYDLVAMIREYAAMRELIWDVVLESRETISLQELRIFFKYLNNAVADAAVEYGSLRDAQLRKLTAQHVAFLAHELRNPLGSARMALDLMAERNESPPSRAFAAVDRGMSRVAQLIDDALVSVRLRELGDIERVPLDVDHLLRDVANESMADAEAKGVVLHVEGRGTVEADPRALRSAISNLVRNAVKFTRAGGHVHVRGRMADARTVIEVEDACGGLPEGTVQKLFDPFVQVGADRSGFGLGLAIAKQAADAHGGQLRVHDLPGKGCVFVLDLPATGSRSGGAPRAP